MRLAAASQYANGMKITPLGFKKTNLTNTTLNKKTVSLEFTETPAISQGLVSNKGVGLPIMDSTVLYT